MKFEEAQRVWKSMKYKPTRREELLKMMYAPPPSQFKIPQWREIRRFCLYMAFTLVILLAFEFFNDWSTGIFAVLSLVLVIDEFLGLRYMRFLPQKATVRKTLLDFARRVERLMVWSLIAHAGIWLAAIVILGMRMKWEPIGTLLWAVLLLPVLLTVSWWTSRKWKRQLEAVRIMLEELNEDKEAGTMKALRS